MLKIWYGLKQFDNEVADPDFFFSEEMNANCIDTDFGRRVVTECSNVYKIHNYATLELPNGELISPKELSSGAKNLLIMMFCKQDVICDLLWCGNNCNKFVAEIANKKDLTVKTTRYYNPYRSEVAFNEPILILNTGDLVNNIEEFTQVFVNKIYDEV